MTSQLRMYTFNRGMMDDWATLFTETLVPMQEKYGIKIEGPAGAQQDQDGRVRALCRT